jgi:hypothetical protein
MAAKTDQEKIDTYNRMVEGARKGGKTEKHFTPISKEKQVEGCRNGGSRTKHFTPESKNRQIEGGRIGGLKHKPYRKSEGEGDQSSPPCK